MRPLQYVLWVNFLAYSILATNFPRLNSEPAIGKAYYRVFPKNDAEVSKTAEFIAQVVGSKDISPWTDVNNRMMHWTVEASPEQVSELRNFTSIDRVDDLIIPAGSTTTEEAPMASSTERLDKREEPPVDQYLVRARDGTNRIETSETEKLLQNLVGEKNVREPLIFDDLIFIWLCTMTTSQRDAALKFPGVKSAGRNARGGHGRHLPRTDATSLPTAIAKLGDVRAKRGLLYSTQVNPVTELVEVSQPSTIPNVGELKNYVYESMSGKDSFVYVVDGGVAYKNQRHEFPNVVKDEEHLQTQLAKEKNYKPWIDIDPASHGTCTASKAVGKEYGVSKQAKLVVVQIFEITAFEMISAITLIVKDIRAKPERNKRSVVNMSLYIEEFDDDDDRLVLKELINKLFDLDVPVVVCAGNFAEDQSRKQVDTYPALFAGPDYPLIVVGSTDHGGALSSFSQRGPKVTLHATGNQITCMGKMSASPDTDRSGTSFSTPIVAGEAANLLSYDKVPFDTSQGRLVRNLRDYLQTDAASWARVPDIRMIWNGVTEKDNPKIGGSNPDPLPLKTCYGLNRNNTYVARNQLVDLTQNKFCPDALEKGNDPGSGSIVRKYNIGTPEELVIAIDVEPGSPLPTKDECSANFMRIIDDCDTGPKDNPANYKGGGTYSHMKRTFHIDPRAVRRPASEGKRGGCESTYKVLWNEFTVWGHGWESTNYGEVLKKEIKGCAILPDTWSLHMAMEAMAENGQQSFAQGRFKNGALAMLARQRAG